VRAFTVGTSFPMAPPRGRHQKVRSVALYHIRIVEDYIVD
jgi:hypothetical protein